MKRQLFILDRQMLDAMHPDEVMASYKDMIELGINHAPYQEFTIQIPFGRIAQHLELKITSSRELGLSEENRNRPFRIEYNLANLSDNEALVNCMFSVEYNGKFYDFIEQLQHNQKIPRDRELTINLVQTTAQYLLTYLVVALATRNVERVTKRNSLAKFGLGKKKQGADYEYVTTLSIGKLVEYEGPSRETGETRRPHLRRGHIRRQHYGPNNQYEKKIWIEPVFVNGYNPNEDHRQAYNVKMEK